MVGQSCGGEEWEDAYRDIEKAAERCKCRCQELRNCGLEEATGKFGKVILMVNTKTVAGNNIPLSTEVAISLPPSLYGVWIETLKLMGRPPFASPSFSTYTNSHTAEMDMKTKQILIDSGFFKSIVERGLREEDAFQAICMHELGHYRYHPYDLATLLLELNRLKYKDGGKFGGQKADSIRLLYDDFCDNLWLLRLLEEPKIDLLYRTTDQDKEGSLILLMRAYLQSVSGVNFGVEESKLNKVIQKKVAELRKIDFFNRETNLDNISRFAEIVMDIFTEEHRDEVCGDTGFKNLCGGMRIKNFSQEDIENSLRKIMNQVSKEDWEDIKKWIDQQSGNMYAKLRIDEEDRARMASIEYYKTKASLYPLRILGMRSVIDGTSKAGIADFDIGDDMSRLNPYKSLGIFIPGSGITKKNLYAPSKKFMPKGEVHDSIIVLDSSGSMTNPILENSNAVLGAFAVAMAYLKNGGKVDVINFSTSAIAVQYSDNEMVYRSLANFWGFGTKPPTEELKKLLEKNNKDITVITDGFNGADSNSIDQFMALLNSVGRTHRVSLVYIGQKIPEEFAMYHNIKFHVVAKEDDIASIVIGDIEWQ